MAAKRKAGKAVKRKTRAKTTAAKSTKKTVSAATDFAKPSNCNRRRASRACSSRRQGARQTT